MDKLGLFYTEQNVKTIYTFHQRYIEAYNSCRNIIRDNMLESNIFVGKKTSTIIIKQKIIQECRKRGIILLPKELTRRVNYAKQDGYAFVAIEAKGD